ncbi:MAG: YegS/Rv2252/BmrU family lipid kinase [Desulfobacterales bacterium]
MKGPGPIDKLCIIFDQRAENDDRLNQGIQKIRDIGFMLSEKRIESPPDAARFAAEAVRQKFDLVLAVGGDGMLNLVVNGMLKDKSGSECAVGLVPFGTGNDFARASGIPLENALDAVAMAIDSTPVLIDVGQVNDTYFVNVVTGGFPAMAAAETSGSAKELLGGFAYFLTGLTKIGSLVAHPGRFTGPGFEWKGKMYACALGNGRRAGGGFSVSPRAVITDGLLDLMIMPESDKGLLSLVSDYYHMSRSENPGDIQYAQLPWLDLSTREPIHLTAESPPEVGQRTAACYRPHRRQAVSPYSEKNDG